ncbi:MAG: serine/threonine protein kinase [Candidatus Eremiobacteraeota bacterium]|nr:serine/threonine protein kinase [Candidatus Eremiobacteraeota bacterium]
MSTVYEVDDLNLHSRWAMKETLDIFPDRDKSDILDQFRKEARILANLSHPNLPKVIDYFSENGKHYLVEELINGVSTSDVLESEGFDEYRILKWAVQVCDLLHFLHGHNIIYRDLKPGNILMDKDDKIYLVDFGIARFFQGGKKRDTVIIGTPGFASPEHYGRGQTDGRSDIYSLGATLHYMVTAEDPAEKPFHFDIPYHLNPDVSFQTSAIIMKCLDMDPVRRYQTAGEVKEAIEILALPALRQGTRKLRPFRKLDNPEFYRNSTDFFGMTTQFLSYLSVFPLSMGMSGVGAFVISFFNPLLGLGSGIISFPLLCMEFWKRLDRVYKNQDILIKAEEMGVIYKSHKLDLNTNWLEILEVRIIKNKRGLFAKKVREIRVITRAGEFSFDPGFRNYHRLVDIIVTQAGLSRVVDTDEVSIYRKYG